MISVVIPCHNEAAVIGRCLEAVLGGDAGEALDVVVVCNGCTDDTAGVARRYAGRGVRVVETEVASKTNALNLGDAAARGFPRFYVDGDVVVSGDALRRMAARMAARGLCAVAPLPEFDVSGSGWVVRAYYATHMRLPASREGIGGSGVYGLSEVGRGRFGRFPDVTADDGFVRLQFSASERETVADCRSVVRAPRTVGELVAIKARSHYGTMELRARLPGLWGNVGERNGGALRRLAAREPWWWPRLAAYAYVKAAARARARRRMRAGAGAAAGWERDESSRVGG